MFWWHSSELESFSGYCILNTPFIDISLSNAWRCQLNPTISTYDEDILESMKSIHTDYEINDIQQKDFDLHEIISMMPSDRKFSIIFSPLSSQSSSVTDISLPLTQSHSSSHRPDSTCFTIGSCFLLLSTLTIKMKSPCRVMTWFYWIAYLNNQKIYR